MDKKNRLFFWIFGLLILASVTAAFLKYFIFLDYTIQAEIDCDPETENCYVYICNPKEEECTGDLEEDTWYYKIISKKAYAFPLCDPYEDEDCVIDCAVGEEDCEIEFCDPNDPESGQECMTPEKYELLPKTEFEDEEETGEEAGEEESLPIPAGEGSFLEDEPNENAAETAEAEEEKEVVGPVDSSGGSLNELNEPTAENEEIVPN